MAKFKDLSYLGSPFFVLQVQNMEAALKTDFHAVSHYAGLMTNILNTILQ